MAVMKDPREQQMPQQSPILPPQDQPIPMGTGGAQIGRAFAEKVLREEQQVPSEHPQAESKDPVAGTTNSLTQQKIGEKELRKAEDLLKKYKAGKKSLEADIISAQQWWKMRNWDEQERERDTKSISQSTRSSTGWLWNCVVAKHADMMGSYPEPLFLAREESDKQEAEMLTSVVPVVLSINHFEDVFDEVSYQKLLEGTGCYGIFWDKQALNGLGEISIKKVNVLNLFWEPGVTDIQDSRHLFHVSLMDNDQLTSMYPELKGKVGGKSITLNKYRYDDNIDTTDKSLVVDWYYHKYEGGKKTVQYCKFCNSVVLYATENDPEMADKGLYDDGNYPFVFDPLYPIEGTPAGYGYIKIGRDPQSDIDILNQALVTNAAMSSTPRYFIRSDGSVNEQEFSDWSKPFVHVNGNLGEDSIAPVAVPAVQGNAINMLAQKIDELKFITGNTDVNNGTTPSGVTAASAIAALQETSGRTSKDLNRGTYRAYTRVVSMVLERIRQFYDLPRQFRITGDRGEQQFVSYSNAGIQPQYQGNDFGVDMGYRLPEFDIDVKAERENAYTRTAQNELAIQLYQLGVFNPQQCDMSLMLLDMMDFSGKDQLQQKIAQMGGMMQQLQQITQIAVALAQQVDPAMAQQLMAITGGGQPAPAAIHAGAGKVDAKTPVGDAQQAQANMTGTSKRGQTMVNNARQRAAETTRPE